MWKAISLRITDIVPLQMPNNIEDTDLVFFCSKCLALDIREEQNILFCPHCYKRKNPATIDVTTWDRWVELHEQKYGHPLVERKTVYDDLHEAFEEEAIETINAVDAINNQLTVRDKLNLNLDRLKE